MNLADRLADQGPIGYQASTPSGRTCNAGAAVDRLDEADRATFDEWLARKKQDSGHRVKPGFVKVASSVAQITGHPCSYTTLRHHVLEVCACYSPG